MILVGIIFAFVVVVVGIILLLELFFHIFVGMIFCFC